MVTSTGGLDLLEDNCYMSLAAHSWLTHLKISFY